MTIRKIQAADFAVVWEIYLEARECMRKNGNPDQWKDNHPSQSMVEQDIKDGTGYVCVENGNVVAAFYFSRECEPTYEKIDGAWLDDEPCGVIHRLARHRDARGAGAFCINWCYEQCHNIKIDTHRDNIPMQKTLAKLGFVYCGIIRVLDDTEERIAYQKTAEMGNAGQAEKPR